MKFFSVLFLSTFLTQTVLANTCEPVMENVPYSITHNDRIIDLSFEATIINACDHELTSGTVLVCWNPITDGLRADNPTMGAAHCTNTLPILHSGDAIPTENDYLIRDHHPIPNDGDCTVDPYFLSLDDTVLCEIPETASDENGDLFIGAGV